jgi:putative transposase
MGRKGSFSPGEFYHVYNRGTERRMIFMSDHDSERFIGLLYLSNGTKNIHISNHQGSALMDWLSEERGDELLVDICAYCLMPNHFHLLLRERVEGGISRFMQKLTTAYTMYFNKRYERSGTLLQGRFKATHASRDEYLSYLVAYIHLNPVKLIEPLWKESGIADRDYAEDYLASYTFSSYPDYLGQDRAQNRLLDMKALPINCDSPKSFSENMRSWLDFKTQE